MFEEGLEYHKHNHGGATPLRQALLLPQQSPHHTIEDKGWLQ